jgi:cellulose synthase/poly-beta-1,6-N-acetylglucosamine synthase-like glycosyltransferase
VIPVFNEIARIPATLREVIQYVESRPEPSEVIVVDDGSGDATAARVEDFCRQYHFLRLIRLPLSTIVRTRCDFASKPAYGTASTSELRCYVNFAPSARSPGPITTGILRQNDVAGYGICAHFSYQHGGLVSLLTKS